MNQQDAEGELPGTPVARFQSQPRWPVLKAFSGANVLFEVFTRTTETIVAPAFRTAIKDSGARNPGGVLSCGCCVDPLRPQSIAAVKTQSGARPSLVNRGMYLTSPLGHKQSFIILTAHRLLSATTGIAVGQ